MGTYVNGFNNGRRGGRIHHDPTDPHKKFLRDMSLIKSEAQRGHCIHPALVPVWHTTYTGDDDGVEEKMKGIPPGFDYDSELRRPCGKKLPCGHICTDPAFWKIEPCNMCTVPVTVVLDCGHETTYYCGRGGPSASCDKDCGRLLACGHPCTKNCSDMLCGKGTCGGHNCVEVWAEQHKELLALRVEQEKKMEAERLAEIDAEKRYMARVYGLGLENGGEVEEPVEAAEDGENGAEGGVGVKETVIEGGQKPAEEGEMCAKRRKEAVIGGEQEPAEGEGANESEIAGGREPADGGENEAVLW